MSLLYIFQSFKIYVSLERNFDEEHNSVVDEVAQTAFSFYSN